MASQQQNIPDEPPPSYSQATGSSSSNTRPPRQNQTQNDHLSVPGSSGPTDADRRSMEDLHRPLPPGWVRCYDVKQHHQFFVDTTQDPPRSIWKHPYDDDTYLRTLTNAERERIQQENANNDRDPHSRHNAIYYDSSDDEEPGPQQSGSSNRNQTAQLPPRPSASGRPSLGRKLKDKLTGMTHEEREAERKRKAEAERQEYERMLRFRQAMARAIETGQPQLLGRDREGKEVYVEPPTYQQGYPGAGSRMYGANAYGINPYAQGMYASPSGPYMRSGYPYGRGYGYGGYRGGLGGGYGLPLALGGGLLGGMLLGDMMF